MSHWSCHLIGWQTRAAVAIMTPVKESKGRQGAETGTINLQFRKDSRTNEESCSSTITQHQTLGQKASPGKPDELLCPRQGRPQDSCTRE